MDGHGACERLPSDAVVQKGMDMCLCGCVVSAAAYCTYGLWCLVACIVLIVIMSEGLASRQ